MNSQTPKAFPSPALFICLAVGYFILGIWEYLQFFFETDIRVLITSWTAALFMTAAGIIFMIYGIQRLPRVADRRFRERYYGSIDLMLQDSRVNKGRVRMFLSRGPKGEIKAIQYVAGTDPVPYQVVVEFVRRVANAPAYSPPTDTLADQLGNNPWPPSALPQGAFPPPYTPQPAGRQTGASQRRLPLPGVFLGLAIACAALALAGILCLFIFYPSFTGNGNSYGGGAILIVICLSVFFMLTFAGVLVIWGLKFASNSASLYFYSHYGNSVERILQESRADKRFIRSLRNAGPRGEAKAIRYVLGFDPVPHEVAREFVSRVSSQS